MAAVFEILIITGLSGAGKTVAMRALEDIGYFCVDNLPPALIPKFVELAKQSGGSLRRVAMACDLRGGALFQPLTDTVRALRRLPDIRLQVVFLEADDETLVRRYKETRRRHPFVDGARLLDGIQAERRVLADVWQEADVVIDTSLLTPSQLKQEIVQRFSHLNRKLPVHIISFGFKYGIPIDADMIFDVRFLPNPHYVDSLRPYSGEDDAVYSYVMQWPATQEFLRRTEDLIRFLIPEFVKEGKSQLVIGVGCTGGRHRSVAIARHLYDSVRSEAEAHLVHRDRHREGCH
ncbi:MAG: RNase adapter RapZ [Alicyclobacillaceae bacterium]|nr:RNase adapter RapZ [Alicyclobacillaceae bacterium]